MENITLDKVKLDLAAFEGKTPLVWALKFHDAYERLAPNFGYETRTETRTFDPETPNGRLMIAVCAEIIASSPIAPSPASEEAMERLKRAAIKLGEAEDLPRGEVKITPEGGLISTIPMSTMWAQEWAFKELLAAAKAFAQFNKQEKKS